MKQFDLNEENFDNSKYFGFSDPTSVSSNKVTSGNVRMSVAQ